jgi:hypothetical protein
MIFDNNIKNIINPYDILIGNNGFLKIDDIELAELKELEIKMNPEMKEIPLLNSVSKGKFMTSINGTITFELNKIYSRFIPSVLESYKYLQPFCFNLEATVHKKNSLEEESIYIGNCWLEGEMDLFSLKAEGDLLTQKFNAGFQIESAQFTSILDDGNEWESLSYKQISKDLE